MCDGYAAQAVGDEHHRLASGGDGSVERSDPLVAVRPLPVALLDAQVLGMRALPERLPVLGA
jgi:hypothetical protein